LGLTIFKPSLIKFTSRKKAIWCSLGALFLITAFCPAPSSSTPQNNNIPKQNIVINKPQEKVEEKIEKIENTPAITTTTQNTEIIQSQNTNTPTLADKPAPTEITKNVGNTQNNSANRYDFYSVVRIIDGDTIEVSINGTNEKLRLIGINTPETVDPGKPVECFGKEASNKAKELLTGKKVRLEYDSSQTVRDKYNRFLVYVFRDDGLFYNKYMIEKGFAYEYIYNTPYKYQAEFKQAQDDAKTSKLGLWADGACKTAVIAETTPTTPNSVTTPTSPSGHIFYTSSHYSSKLYYCDTDKSWESLSKSYLKTFNSEAEVLAKYPTKTLNEPCK
jgi:endonuclease YncB( thermonuclease family)